MNDATLRALLLDTATLRHLRALGSHYVKRHFRR